MHLCVTLQTGKYIAFTWQYLLSYSISKLFTVSHISFWTAARYFIHINRSFYYIRNIQYAKLMDLVIQQKVILDYIDICPI